MFGNVMLKRIVSEIRTETPMGTVTGESDCHIINLKLLPNGT